MNTIVIAGGNSGIGLRAAREVLAAGHRVIILGRDKQQGEDALASFGGARERSVFLSVELSTHAGVREAARLIDDLTDRIDGLLHAAGAFDTRDIRTADGLKPFFALSFLGRYHLTQLLLPRLLLAERPRVVMFTASLAKVPTFDPKIFPYFKGLNVWSMVPPVNGARQYYADALTKTHPKMFAGTVSAGFARTDVFREAPWFMKVFVALTAPSWPAALKPRRITPSRRSCAAKASQPSTGTSQATFSTGTPSTRTQ